MLININHPANSHNAGNQVARVINADFVEQDFITNLLFDFSLDDEIGRNETKKEMNSILSKSMQDLEFISFNPINNV